jgi:hypothetical protein
MKRPRIGIWILLGGALIGLAFYFFFIHKPFESQRWLRIRTWISDPASHPEWAITAGDRCGNAPFMLPTNGLVGYLWGDNFQVGHPHQGIDIFGGKQPGVTPVVAAYDGYLTRMGDWKSSVIIRIPSDPLAPGRQIWAYYTHMADAKGDSYISSSYPPGTSEVFVKAGTLLGYQGDYSGDANHPVGVHLHFSIVKDNDKNSFSNELEIANTYDPSPYLGLNVNFEKANGDFPVCTSTKDTITP